MNLESVRAFKQQVSAEVVAQGSQTPEARAFFEATEPPMPARMALGVAGNEIDGYKLAIRTNSRALAERMAARVNGEADIRIVSVKARYTPAWLQARQRPLECGLQVQIAGAGFVGTAGCIVKDGRGFYILSNSHVLADMGRTPLGTAITQPRTGSSNVIGVLDRYIPFSLTSPNLVDCALARLSKVEVLLLQNGALQGNIRGVLPVTAADLGIESLKLGRTTGVRNGRLTAAEIDGLPVNMGALGVVRFNDQVEFSGGPGNDFSAGGDSGSLIVDRNGFGRALLFAGGNDASGEDFTYGNRLDNVLAALGVTLAI